MIITLCYLVLINLLGLFSVAFDKLRKKYSPWKIPTPAFLGFSLIGASIGILLGMLLFRHKLNKKWMTIGVPLILVAQIIAVFYLYGKLHI
jgi:uncharacterized membrane protein YsdA (DUF1294 family)